MLYGLSIDGAEYVKQAITEHAMPGVNPVPGYLHVSRHDAAGEMRAERDLLRRLGSTMELWQRDKVREILRTGRYHQALFEPDGFHIHPLNYCLGLATAAQDHGVAIHEGSPVQAVMGGGDGSHVVHTPHGSVRAQHVVYCVSAYAGNTFPHLSAAILPIATYVATTSDLGPALEETVRTKAAVVDTRRASDYYRRIPGNRLLWGGRDHHTAACPQTAWKRSSGEISGRYIRNWIILKSTPPGPE